MLVAEGKPQRYGTQVSIQGGELLFHPIEDSLHVDERRAEMGLKPLEAYERGLREMYLPPAGNDPAEP